MSKDQSQATSQVTSQAASQATSLATIIDGKAIAAELRGKIADAAAKLKAEHDIIPGLAVVLLGEDPASQVYVRNKGRQTVKAGMHSFEHKLPDTTSEKELLELIKTLNADASVHGILVQLPLPGHINEDRIIEAIDPAKDVDGFHPVNVGRLSTGQAKLIPCTPQGCIMLAKTVHPDLTGLNAVVVGRSNIVGKPVAQLLLAENATVTIAHSRTRDLAGLTRTADILIAAVGRPEMITGDWIRPGATIIDVGINRIDDGSERGRLVGDVDFASASEIAGAITPVPGGVGPMTIACLLRNTLIAACAQAGVEVPEI